MICREAPSYCQTSLPVQMIRSWNDGLAGLVDRLEVQAGEVGALQQGPALVVGHVVPDLRLVDAVERGVEGRDLGAALRPEGQQLIHLLAGGRIGRAAAPAAGGLAGPWPEHGTGRADPGDQGQGDPNDPSHG